MFTNLLSAIVLVINEVMASNAGMAMSPAINFDGWIEVYNPSSQAVNLSGMYLSDSPEELMRWKMPANIGSVPAKGFKVIWLGSSDIKTNQAPFKLQCDGGTICLSDKSGNLIVSQTYPEALSRTSYARTTDGGDEWSWTAEPTPGATNATSTFASERLEPPVCQGSRTFSTTLSFQVAIPEGTTLRYTTDGSLPTLSNGQQSKEGKFSLTKTSNLTFRLFREGYLPSVPVTRSFIRTSTKYTLPIISIVGDKKFFTDPKIGIDCDGDGTNGKTGNGQDWPKNYNMPWDRPVNFSYLTPEGKMLFNQDVNISISGGWTRAMSKRSFKLKSNKIFDGQNHFDFSFFPQKPFIRNKTILLRNGGNDYWTHNSRFMDPALETIIQRSGIDLDVQSYVPIIEYVNGEFRGVLNLREPNNDKFAYANFGYDDEELDMFENFYFKLGNDDALKRLYELGASINDAGAYDELKQLLDIDEFTNYMAIEMFLGNDDWPDNNIKAYRNQHDGRFRFVCFDLDYAFGLRYNTANDNPFTFFSGFKQMEFVNFFLNLLNHEGYRRKFIDTFCLVGGSVFDRTKANAIINELIDDIRPMISLPGDGQTPDRSANTIKSKLVNRQTRLVSCMQQFSPLKLKGVKKQTLNLSANVEGANLYVNGLNVPYAQFKGQVFAPMELEAKAPAGYRFTGWKNGATQFSTDPVTSLPPDNNLSIVACFEPLSADELAAEGITPIRINEVSAANGIHVNDYFKRNDWIELYNTTSEDIDVEGMYLSDNLENPFKYQITKGETQASTVVPAHGYLIVWCDKLEPQSQLHASFKLAAEGGNVLLTAADESWLDRLTYTAMESDQTAGRYPDGAAEVITMNVPTIAKANLTSSYAQSIPQTGTSGIRDLALETAQEAISSRYVLGSLIVRGMPAAEVRSAIYTASGQLAATYVADMTTGYAEFSLSQLPTGIYLARINDNQGRTTTYKFVKK